LFKEIIMSKLKSILGVLVAGSVASLAVIEPAMARDVGAVAQGLTGQAQGITAAVGSISAAAGFVVAAVAAFKFKSHKDNPQQTPLSVPIVYLLVASLLLYLPEVIQTGSETFWGAGAKTQGLDGGKMGTGF
jgi:intracellular multiplication protein IcmD